MLMKVDKSTKMVSEKEGGQGNKYINKAGLYDVTVLALIFNESKAENSDSATIEFYVDFNGEKQVIYGNLRIFNKDGSINEIGQKTLNNFLITQDIDGLPDPVEAELPVGKEGAMKEVLVIPGIEDINVTIWISQEFSKYNGKITEKKIIRNFYRADDKATASEIVYDKEFGVQYEKDKEYLESSEDNGVKYDGVTKKEVLEWKESLKGGGKTAEKPSFGKKPRFGKK